MMFLQRSMIYNHGFLHLVVTESLLHTQIALIINQQNWRLDMGKRRITIQLIQGVEEWNKKYYDELVIYNGSDFNGSMLFIGDAFSTDGKNILRIPLQGMCTPLQGSAKVVPFALTIKLARL
uniref:Uncharacterized protein n=1 Tax=Lactuca sativa TaxID=4236 RepID=A0A9R1VKU1_LACSA|nr:hypothetical protein LSAT_V11C400198950 [Lactuca sativa]